MSLNKLLMLNESLVEKVQKNTFQPAFPIKASKPPINAIAAWEKDGNKLTKTFSFKEVFARNSFITQLLSYESEKGHYGRFWVLRDRVKVTVSTEGLTKPTELDKEYSKGVDAIYKDCVGEYEE